MEWNVPPPPRRSRARIFWGILGVTLVTVLCLGALAYVGFAVLMVIGLNQLGSNK